MHLILLYASFRYAICGGRYAVCSHTKYILELFNLRLFTKCMLCGSILSVVLTKIPLFWDMVNNNNDSETRENKIKINK